MVLSITDGAWLLVESREAPQHVGGLMVFSDPDAESVLRGLWERWRARTDLQPPFSWRLARPDGLAGTFSWAEDPGVDLDYHLRLSALPSPGRVRELFVLVSRLHSTPLDRHRPLWEIHLVEGLRPEAEGGPPRFAIYAKFHHSMFDGVGAMRMVRRMLSTDPDEGEMPPPWTLSADAPRRTAEDSAVHVDRQRGFDPLAAVVGPVRSAATVAGALAGQFVDRKRRVEGEVLPFSAPPSILNGRITGARRFAADGWAFERIRGTAKRLDASINDVALAMSSSALRRYLLEQGALPDRALTAMVPVSIRSEAQGASGNQLSFLVADLATDLADPADRLARISRSMERGKRRLSSMSAAERIGYALAITSPYVVGPMLGLAGHGRPVANVVISNVPGAREPRYLDGARLQGMYPASLLQQGQALNITLTSYDTEVQFGLTACRHTLPGIQRMLGGLEEGLAELERL
jgi:diacylglycerol O-acyltransferase / wax synthase